MITFKIPQGLVDLMRKDIERRHAFAAERIGFLGTTSSSAKEGSVILATSFYPVEDDHYVPSKTMGAKINSDAIRSAMQIALDKQEGLFHVHVHWGSNTVPRFSPIDLHYTPPIVRSLHNAYPSEHHGMLVLNDTDWFGLVWPPGAARLRPLNRIVTVGSPMKIWGYG